MKQCPNMTKKNHQYIKEAFKYHKAGVITNKAGCNKDPRSIAAYCTKFFLELRDEKTGRIFLDTKWVNLLHGLLLYINASFSAKKSKF